MVADRRTIIVLAALVGGMTLVSSLLLVLEPGPIAPLSGVSLQSIDNTASEPEDKLFDLAREARPWKAIVIHDSGTLRGSSRSLNELHEKLGRKGLGYHFVINNGQGETDGLIEVGFRWKQQFPGEYLEGEGADWYHRNAISICLVGDADRQRMTDAQMRELVWLVQQLQQQYNIPRQMVFVDVGSGGEGRPGAFPQLWFRDQLLTPSLP